MSSTRRPVAISTPRDATFLDVLVDHPGGEPVPGDGQSEHAAGLRASLQDGDPIPLARQLPGRSQAGRSRSPITATRLPLAGALSTAARAPLW